MADCRQELAATNLTITGFSKAESVDALCQACRYNKAYTFNRPITKDVLASLTGSRWSELGKSVLGGLQHVVSVDNAAGYAELWYKGGSWYAVTGAELSKAFDSKTTKSAVWEVPGITSGMKLAEAATRFLEAVYGPANLQKGCGCAGK